MPLLLLAKDLALRTTDNFLNCGQLAAPVQRLRQEPTATLQVAQHGLGQDLHGLLILGPLQLLLALHHVLEHVLQPQKIGFTLAHSRHLFAAPSRALKVLGGTVLMESNPRANLAILAPEP